MKRLNLINLETDRCPITDKIQYNTREEAKLPCKFTGEKNNTKYNIYICRYCGKYHVGAIHYKSNLKESRVNVNENKNRVIRNDNGTFYLMDNI